MGTIHKKQVNKVNLIVSIIVFGTGLILLIRFHIGLWDRVINRITGSYFETRKRGICHQYSPNPFC